MDSYSQTLDLMHVPTDASASMPEPGIKELFDTAMEAREDGDYDIAVDILRELEERDPSNKGVMCQLMETLVRAGRVAEADDVLAVAVARFPDDIGFAQMWSDLPDMLGSWEQSIERKRSVLDAHAGWDKPEFLPFILRQALPLFEWRRRDAARDLIDAAWPLIMQTGRHPLPVLYALENLAMYDRMAQFCERVLADMPRGEFVQDTMNLRNYQSIAEAAQDNTAWLKEHAEGLRVVSLGQNCLPYTVSARWGISPTAALDDAFTPFDMGSFNGDHSAAMVAANFAPLQERDAFHEAPDPATRAPTMRHRPTNVLFFHARGRSTIGPDQQLFHQRLEREIGAFRQACESRAIVFVFSIVGAGSIDPLIAALWTTLARGNARLLVMNHTRHAVPFQPHPYVTCRDLIFPDNYSWNIAADYTSDRGTMFELRVAGAIKAEIKRCLRQIKEAQGSAWTNLTKPTEFPPAEFPDDTKMSRLGRLGDMFRRRSA
jgi:hypothetical protein